MDENKEVSVLKSSVDVESVSVTVKSLVATLLPLAHIILNVGFDVTIVSQKIDACIDAVVILITQGTALWGYIRTKKAMGMYIKRLGGNLGSVGVHYKRN